MPHILIVDDNVDVREALVQFLESAGFTTTTAEGARHALAQLQQASGQKPDVILVDLVMPQMDGLTFARELETTFARSIPLVLMSALEASPAAERLGYPLVRKPDLEDLVPLLLRRCRRAPPRAYAPGDDRSATSLA